MPNHQRPPYSLCICPDSRLLKVRLDALLAGHPPREGGPWQRFVFWADEGLGAPFWEHLTLQGLFATPKFLVIRNGQDLLAENLKPLSKALVSLAGAPGAPLPSPLVWPVLCLEVAFERGKAKIPSHISNLDCYIQAEKNGWLDITQGLTPASLPAFIRAEADRQNIVLGQHEVAMLAQSLTPDASFVVSELGKLALLADADGKLPKSLDILAGQAQEVSIFEIIRLVQQNRNAPAVWRQILGDKLTGDSLVFGFNANLIREARVLWQTLAGKPPPLPPQVAMQKKITAESLGFAGIAKIWNMALEADKGIKTGERSADQAFEMLAAELFRLFGTQRR